MSSNQQKLEKDLIITQSNIFALGDKNLFKKNEKKVTWLAIAFLKPYEFPKARVYKSDIRRLLNISETNNSFNSRLDQMAVQLRGKTWLVPGSSSRGAKGRGAVGLFDKVFVEDDGAGECMEFTFSEDMREHVLNIASKRFFKYHVYHRIRLETDAAESLFDYVMTQHFRSGGEFEITAALSEKEKQGYQEVYFNEKTPLMTEMLGFELKGAYLQWSNIRDKQLDRAIKDLNENSELIDIEPDWTPLYERRKGRGRKKIVGIKLAVKIHKSKQEQAPFHLLESAQAIQGELLPLPGDELPDIETKESLSPFSHEALTTLANQTLREHGVGLTKTAELLGKYGPNHVLMNIDAVKFSLSTANNPAGLVIKAIEENYSLDNPVKPPSGVEEEDVIAG